MCAHFKCRLHPLAPRLGGLFVLFPCVCFAIFLSLSLQDFSTFYGAGLVSACVCLKGVLLLVVVRRGKGEEKTERTGKRWLGKGKMSLGFWSCGAFACMCVHVRARSRRDLALFILHVWK